MTSTFATAPRATSKMSGNARIGGIVVVEVVFSAGGFVVEVVVEVVELDVAGVVVSVTETSEFERPPSHMPNSTASAMTTAPPTPMRA